MKVIAIVAQKGGTGKTTMAVSLAVAAEHSGYAAAIVDLDPQASAANWSDRRAAETPVVVSTQASRLAHVLEAAKGKADLVLVDTPPRAEQAAISAVSLADLVVIPCRPAILDLETIRTTVDLVRYAGDKPIIVVLNAVPARGQKGQQATEVLQSMGPDVCPAAFGSRVAFAHAVAAGLSAEEYDPRGKAGTEIRQVYKYIHCHLYKYTCIHV